MTTPALEGIHSSILASDDDVSDDLDSLLDSPDAKRLYEHLKRMYQDTPDTVTKMLSKVEPSEVQPETTSPEHHDLPKRLVIDGPLSHIYTEALNIAFAKEGMMASSIGGDTLDTEDESSQGVYVYCCDGEMTVHEMSSAVESLDIARDRGYSRYILAVETTGLSSHGSRIDILEGCLESMGGDVYYQRDRALSVLRGCL